jgi:ankyrin repeat protein
VQEGFEVDFCNTPDHHGFTALHAACLSGQMESAKVLLANGANINKTTSSGDYPFMLAIISGSPSLVSYLLDMGARYDVVDKFGNTPLHLAMADGNRNIVMILIQKKFSVHPQNRQGLSPLLCAVINGHRCFLYHFPAKICPDSSLSAVVKLLCNHDISVLGACTLRGEFPLHLAALLPPTSRKQMISALIDCKAVPTLVNSSGLTGVLHRAYV